MMTSSALFARSLRRTCLAIACAAGTSLAAQTVLPTYPTNQVERKDWLVDKIETKTGVYQTVEGHIVLSNGLTRRVFTQSPNVATISLDELTTNTSLLRSIRPEATIDIDGHHIEVGGLTGQPVHNYLLKQWLPTLKADPKAMKMKRFRVENTKERFGWMKRRQWMPKDMPWPAPGKELIFSYGLDDEAITALTSKGGVRPDYLKDIEVEVHYELYDGMPVYCKWMTMTNHSQRTVTVNRFVSEIIAAVEPESSVDERHRWRYPNITVDTDYNFGGMSEEYIYASSVAWKQDPLYKTQVNVERTTPCLLEVAPKLGPEQQIAPGKTFSSFRAWELINDSEERERKSLGYRRMMRAMAPWVTENPILMHVRTADSTAVKHAIDQCAEVGFEMVIMTFWSGFDAEDESAKNLGYLKRLADYAHERNIALGGYSLLASRSIDRENDVLLPEGQQARFLNSPCIESRWGQDYMRKLYQLYTVTGLDVLEHDGSYPGDVCHATYHPGHRGIGDSQWNQMRTITDYYKWCRSKGIYLNIPDLYFLNGGNKTGMGYREANWSLPRAQQEIVERQNIFDGTWLKAPSMGWMFVPLVEYQGGGEAATIEPLKDHLPHYGQRLANLFGAGVQACYRGPQLYDTPETKQLVKTWVDFYKKHREVLDGDIIHVRRPDGRDYDAILHVNPHGKERGLLMVYNPLEEPIRKQISVDLYYTGLTQTATLCEQDGKARKVRIDDRHKALIDIEVPAKSQTWFVIR